MYRTAASTGYHAGVARSIAAFALACVLVSAPAAADSPMSVGGNPVEPARPRPHILGHRGMGWNHPRNPLPQNTRRSVRAAVDAGADGVEIDVYRTSDGVIVLRHDDELSQTSPGGLPRSSCSGRVTRSRWDDIAGCQGQAFGDDGERAPLTRLEEVLALDGLGQVVVDVKNDQDGVEAMATVEAILAAVHASGRADRTILMLYRAETVAAVRHRGVRTCLKLEHPARHTPAGLARLVADSGAWAACASGALIEPDVMAALRERGLEMVSFVLVDRVDADYDALIRKSAQLGVYGVITDLVEHGLAVRDGEPREAVE